MRQLLAVFGILAVVALLTSCTFEKPELGTAKNPIKVFFVPSVEAKTLSDKSAVIKSLLEEITPYEFEIRIPESYIAVVEAFGAKRVDIAALNTFGYILAHEKFGAQAPLKVVRYGSPNYRSAIYAHADSGIKSLADLAGKNLAFVDPASISGFMLPSKEIKDANVTTGEHIFAMSHDAVISMIYQNRVPAGAAFYSPPHEDGIEDARRLVKTQFPDVEEKVKIIHLTKEIPNEPIVFRKDMPDEMKANLVAAFEKLSKMEEGKEALREMFGITELEKTSDKEYDSVREMIKTLGKSATDLVSGKK